MALFRAVDLSWSKGRGTGKATTIGKKDVNARNPACRQASELAKKSASKTIYNPMNGPGENAYK